MWITARGFDEELKYKKQEKRELYIMWSSKWETAGSNTSFLFLRIPKTQLLNTLVPSNILNQESDYLKYSSLTRTLSVHLCQIYEPFCHSSRGSLKFLGRRFERRLQDIDPDLRFIQFQFAQRTANILHERFSLGVDISNSLFTAKQTHRSVTVTNVPFLPSEINICSSHFASLFSFFVVP